MHVCFSPSVVARLECNSKSRCTAGLGLAGCLYVFTQGAQDASSMANLVWPGGKSFPGCTFAYSCVECNATITSETKIRHKDRRRCKASACKASARLVWPGESAVPGCIFAYHCVGCNATIKSETKINHKDRRRCAGCKNKILKARNRASATAALKWNPKHTSKAGDARNPQRANVHMGTVSEYFHRIQLPSASAVEASEWISKLDACPNVLLVRVMHDAGVSPHMAKDFTGDVRASVRLCYQGMRESRSVVPVGERKSKRTGCLALHITAVAPAQPASFVKLREERQELFVLAAFIVDSALPVREYDQMFRGDRKDARSLIWAEGKAPQTDPAAPVHATRNRLDKVEDEEKRTQQDAAGYAYVGWPAAYWGHAAYLRQPPPRVSRRLPTPAHPPPVPESFREMFTKGRSFHTNLGGPAVHDIIQWVKKDVVPHAVCLGGRR